MPRRDETRVVAITRTARGSASFAVWFGFVTLDSAYSARQALVSLLQHAVACGMLWVGREAGNEKIVGWRESVIGINTHLHVLQPVLAFGL